MARFARICLPSHSLTDRFVTESIRRAAPRRDLVFSGKCTDEESSRYAIKKTAQERPILTSPYTQPDPRLSLQNAAWPPILSVTPFCHARSPQPSALSTKQWLS